MFKTIYKSILPISLALSGVAFAEPNVPEMLVPSQGVEVPKPGQTQRPKTIQPGQIQGQRPLNQTQIMNQMNRQRPSQTPQAKQPGIRPQTQAAPPVSTPGGMPANFGFTPGNIYTGVQKAPVSHQPGTSVPARPASIAPPMQAIQPNPSSADRSLQSKIDILEAEISKLRGIISEKDAALDKAISRLAKNIGVAPPKSKGKKVVKRNRPATPVVSSSKHGITPPIQITSDDAAEMLEDGGWEQANFAGIGRVQAKYGKDKVYVKVHESKANIARTVMKRGIVSSVPTRDGHVGFVLDMGLLNIR